MNKFVDKFCKGDIDVGLDDYVKEIKLSKCTIELNNRHVAMLGIIYFIVHTWIVPLGYQTH